MSLIKKQKYNKEVYEARRKLFEEKLFMYKEDNKKLKEFIKDEFIFNYFEDYGFILDGWFYTKPKTITSREAIFLYLLCKIKNTTNILEIGCETGLIGMICCYYFSEKFKDSSKIGYLTCVDSLQKEEWENTGNRNINNIIKKYGCSKRINYKLEEEVNNENIKEANLIIFNKKKVHSYDEVVSKFDNIFSLAVKGSVIVIDNVFDDDIESLIYDRIINGGLKGKVQNIYISKDHKTFVKNNKFIYAQYEDSYLHPKTMFAFLKL